MLEINQQQLDNINQVSIDEAIEVIANKLYQLYPEQFFDYSLALEFSKKC